MSYVEIAIIAVALTACGIGLAVGLALMVVLTPSQKVETAT